MKKGIGRQSGIEEGGDVFLRRVEGQAKPTNTSKERVVHRQNRGKKKKKVMDKECLHSS